MRVHGHDSRQWRLIAQGASERCGGVSLDVHFERVAAVSSSVRGLMY